jgi:hypothetical protein
MGSGSGSGPARRPRRGRHRRAGTGDSDDTGDGGDTTAVTGRHRRPEIGPGDPPPVDPLCDTGSTGLRMFNLGTIPASVTPPRSWRRAAWFTVIASVAALAGLLTVAAVMVLPQRDTSRIAAPPYFPAGRPLVALGSEAPSGSRGATRTGPVSPDGVAGIRPLTGHVPTAVPTTWSPPGTGSGGPPTTSRRPSPPVAGTPPVITPVTDVGEPVVDPTQLIKRTRTFFAEVTSDARAAADLTTGTVHDDAVALIHQRYGDLSSIQIQRIGLDPVNGLTVCVVRITGKDGGTQVRTITLRFTPGADPKIINPGG